jgi:hypothetical protein
MSSLQDLRKKQIAEVIDADRNISKKVFHQQFKTVQQFQDTLKQPSPTEKKISYEIEKYIIELESLLTDIQNELEQKLAPFESKILEQVGEPDIEEEEEEEEIEEAKVEEELPIGLVEGEGKRMKGGIKEVKFSLLEIWNKFVNYVSKLADLQRFTQNDLIVLYDRLDDLLPILQSITRLNLDAKSVNVPPIGEGIVEVLQSKIANRDISPIIPTKDLPTFSSGYKLTLQKKLKDLKDLLPFVNTKEEQRIWPNDVNPMRQKIGRLRRAGRNDDAKKEEDLYDLKAQKYKKTNEVRMYKEEVEAEIKRLEATLKKGRFPQEVIKASRQPLRGQGKTASSQILKTFGDDVYRLYESIPSLSYDQLEDLYIDLQDKLKFAQENNDNTNWEKYNFLINAVLSDERAKDIQRILGNGRMSKSDYKYSRISMPLPFKDADNEMYAY